MNTRNCHLATDASSDLDSAANLPLENARESLVQRAIAAHRAAVHEDEKSYDDDCVAVSENLAASTAKIESTLFQALAMAPCQSDADVQAKINYLLTGDVGVRTPMAELFGYEDYGGSDLIPQFIKSLRVPS